MAEEAGTRRIRHGSVVSMALLLAACLGDAAVGPTPGSPTFHGEAAMARVREQVAFGPRIPGTDGHTRQLDWMLAQLDSSAGVLVADTFSHVTTRGDSLELVNVLARFAPEATRRILILTHWDTRPASDQAVDTTLHSVPVPGANDGGSGTAVLLTLAPLLAAVPPPTGVDLLFVDGEDYGPGVEDMLIGTIRYAETLPDDDRPVYGLLLDMVGDADASFPVEGISAQAANVVVQKVWRAAERLGYRKYFPRAAGIPLTDDHVPLIRGGIPTADLIDFTYGPDNRYWHTPEDTPDHVSAATLGMVGAVVVELIYSGG